jgi:hypothetical protein
MAIGCFLCGQISYKMIHRCDYKNHESATIKKLEAENKFQDSLLKLWVGDHAWRIRVIAGMEKDTAITKYQKWRKKK